MVLSSCSSHLSTTLSPARGAPQVSTGQAGPPAAPAGGLSTVTVTAVAASSAVTTTVDLTSLCLMDSGSSLGSSGSRRPCATSTRSDETGRRPPHDGSGLRRHYGDTARG